MCKIRHGECPYCIEGNPAPFERRSGPQALAAINGSSGRSWATLQRFPDNICTSQPYNFSLGLHCKVRLSS
jgi:hypothetical protein